jgi:hypothetical protein
MLPCQWLLAKRRGPCIPRLKPGAFWLIFCKTTREVTILIGGRIGEVTPRQCGGAHDTITARQHPGFVLDVSLPGVQILLSIAAEAQRVIDGNERLQRAA